MKPYVICLMHSSLDGRTHPSRWRPKGAGTDWFERSMANSAATPG
ncbi:riboflavin biosynthesis pyrimidine reductase [Bradyrhizobium japonicum]